MSKPFPLQTLLDLARDRCDDAALKLGVVNGHEADMQKRLQLLHDYRNEYAARLTSGAQAGMDPMEWRNFRYFIDAIDAAIEQQRAMVVLAGREVEAGRDHWQAQRRRLKSFDTLSQRYRTEQRSDEARLEQKEQDEFSLKNYFGSRTSMG